MALRRWERAEIEALVQGRTLYLRDESGGTVEGPAWLRAAAGRISPLDSAECIAVTHPDDQSALYGSYLASLERPGERCGAHLRIFLDDHWGHHEIEWVNLLDDPEVGVNLCVEWEVPGPSFPAPDGVGAEGRHDDANWALLDVDAAGVITSVVGEPTGTLGRGNDELLGHPVADFLHPDSVGPAVLSWLAVRHDPDAAPVTQRRWLRPDGSDVLLETSYLNAAASGGAADGGVRLIIHDIADRLRAEEELARRRHELEVLAEELDELAGDVALLADEVPFPVFRADRHGAVRFHNARWADLAAGGTDLHALVDASDSRALADSLNTVARTGDDTAVEVRAADGVRHWRLHLQRTHGAGDDEGDIVGAVEDITATIELRQQAEHDPLTGLASRALAELHLAHAVDTDPEGTVVVYIDLDGFKAVNDRYGHAAGDAVLQAVGRRLAAAVRPTDLVSRLGGDEFVVVCGGLDPAPAVADAVVARLERALAGPVTFSGTSWEPRASLGAARPRPGESPAAVLRRADQTMFASKRLRGAAR